MAAIGGGHTMLFPRGIGIACLLALAFLVLSLDVKHLVAVGYGGVVAAAHVSRSRWRL
jgi:hypothetical protein